MAEEIANLGSRAPAGGVDDPDQILDPEHSVFLGNRQILAETLIDLITAD